MPNIEKLKLAWLDARTRAESRFPGSFIAGPANYPIARHEKAWKRVERLREEYETAAHKEHRSQIHHEHMERLTAQTNAIAGDFISNLAIGDIVIGRWTNSNQYMQAPVKIVKLNARTIKGELLNPVQGKYGIWAKGQILIFPKLDTPGNGIGPQ